MNKEKYSSAGGEASEASSETRNVEVNILEEGSFFMYFLRSQLFSELIIHFMRTTHTSNDIRIISDTE